MFLRFVFLGMLLYCFVSSIAQYSNGASKSFIDSAAIANWADLLWSEPSITPDGKYFMYPIDNLPVGSKTLVIQSTENEWKKEFVGADIGFFSGNGKLAVFKRNDSLYLLSLGSTKIEVVPNVASYKNPKEGTGQWLAYLTKANGLTLYNLVTGKKQQYHNVSDYQFENDGRVLLIKTKGETDSVTSESVEWLTLSTGKQYSVWQSEDSKVSTAKSFSFDEGGKQLVFIVQNRKKSEQENTIWYYSEGAKAIEKITNETPGIDSGMIVTGSSPSFSKNGKYIFFKIQPRPEPPLKPNPNAVQVDVWSYKDLVMQNIQLSDLKNAALPSSVKLKEELTAVLNIANYKLSCFEKNGAINLFIPGPDDYAILCQRKYIGDKQWLDEPLQCYLISLKEGTSRLFTNGFFDFFSFSPGGEYFIFYDQEKRHFFSYSLGSGEIKNISSGISEPITLDSDKGSRFKTSRPIGIKGWLSNRELIIYGRNDLWRVNIAGLRRPSNLTSGFGKQHELKFRLVEENNPEKGVLYDQNKPLLLTAFDYKTKANSFYRVYPGISKKPEQLSKHSFLIYTTGYQTEVGLPEMRPVKAAKNDVWIVKRQSSTSAPNFFVTSDFKAFKQLTDLQPQKQYNWYTTELLTWKQLDGKACQGILYKPENFDSSKKYPVIVNYYEKVSDGLHQFRRPDFIEANLDIPWFVSKGYLVFTPDIQYTIGKAGESTVNSVVNGTKYLFQRPYVDSSKVGIQGHSWGGYETNYLISHSNVFAAAVEGAGPTNHISSYGALLLDGSPNNGYHSGHFEKGGQLRLQATLWEDRDIYIHNSPLFYADKVSTPLLMMHNKNDAIVPWSQAVEFFIGLRRLDKPVWMLQYDNGGHGVGGRDAVDYTTRMTQYFDHYLKGAPPPKWMTVGIPARLKGIETGYELDPNGSCGKDCKICKEKKYSN